MKMGLVTSTNRHTALDATVVYHEYMHGVTNRLVGGPQNVQALEAPQCRGMGEGWGDYIACVLTETNAIASWSVNQPNGVRGFVYDTNFPAQTENFSRLGAGRYTVEHNIGEIWCATLLEMNRRIGMANALPLIIDALKLSPSNPSFLDMRDAILAALDFTRDAAAASSAPMTPRAYAEQRLGIWQAFARFGMGPGARCNGPFLTGIVADFNLPAGVSDLPTQPIQPSQPAAPGAIVVTSPATFQAIAIPDNNPQGIESALEVVQQGTAQAIKVSLNIIHPVPEDLVVTLRSPSGQEAILFDSGASPRPNLITTYDSGSSATLAGLTGQPIHGSWTLHVADQVRKDTGSLNSWALELTPAGSGAGSDAGLVSGDAGSAPALDTTFQITLDFPSIDAKEDFLVAFRGWFIQYQQTSTAIEALKRSSDEARRFIEEQRSGADLIHAGGIFEE
jgi:extracellular elastinolytic metalloproteinase